MTAHRLVDLFAGAGGLTRGFLDTGAFRSVAAVERDMDAAATFALNFGAHVSNEDISDWARKGLPLAEVVVGGPPCQGFSNLGKRNADDPRNALWSEYVDVLARLRPAFFVLENVPPFLASRSFDSLTRETGSGRLRPWEIESFVLDAWAYGSGQVRKRAIVIGRPRGMRPLGPPPPVNSRLVLRDVLGSVPPQVDVRELPDSSIEVFGQRLPGPYKSQELHLGRYVSAVSLERYRAIPAGGARQDLPDRLKLPAWRRPEFKGAQDVMGRLRWDRPSVTIRTEFFRPEKGRFLHPDEHRPLTHYEAALLQGFSDDHLWCGSKASIARQIGNAVPVPLARALAERLLRHLR